jgi:hypothetical protein
MARKGLVRVKPLPGYEAAPFEKFDAYAIKALAGGVATEGQQKRALDWIIRLACGTYDNPFVPGSERETCFNAGKAFVGQQIVGIINLDGSLLSKDDKAE